MEDQKFKKEVLLEEISELTRQIEDARKSQKKSITKLRERLIKLILELDFLGKDEEP
jgi:DNA-binding protein H-NS